MRFRLVLCLLLAIFIGVRDTANAKESMTASSNNEHQRWLLDRIKEAKSIKTGIARAALLRLFAERIHPARDHAFEWGVICVWSSFLGGGNSENTFGSCRVCRVFGFLVHAAWRSCHGEGRSLGR